MPAQAKQLTIIPRNDRRSTPFTQRQRHETEIVATTKRPERLVALRCNDFEVAVHDEEQVIAPFTLIYDNCAWCKRA